MCIPSPANRRGILKFIRESALQPTFGRSLLSQLANSGKVHSQRLIITDLGDGCLSTVWSRTQFVEYFVPGLGVHGSEVYLTDGKRLFAISSGIVTIVVVNGA